MTKNAMFSLLCSSLLALGASAACAQQTQSIPLDGIPDNQEMRILTIELAPGQASAPHRHNAHVFVYVLEGEIEMQVRGGPLTRLQAGDSFYESPADIHQVSRNASSSAAAKFVVHMLRTAGTPVSIPVE
ncbi:MAG: cupin domain-containing protein [Gammaproteobacteria bacterium]